MVGNTKVYKPAIFLHFSKTAYNMSSPTVSFSTPVENLDSWKC